MKRLTADFEHTPTILKWTILLSVALFFFSLKEPAFFIDKKVDPGAWSNSLLLFLTGWTSLLGGAFLHFIIWLANPIYLCSIIFTLKSKLAGLFLSLASTALALLFCQLDTIVTSESGGSSRITSLGLGFKLWLASFMVLSLGTALSLVLVKQRRTNRLA